MIDQKKHTLTGVILILFSFNALAHENQKSPQQENIYVTIFVHGAISIRPYLNLPNLVRLVRDKLENSVYKLSVEIIRDDPYIFQTQVMQEQGLKVVDMKDDRQSASATLFCHLYDKVLKEIYPERKNTLYYTYGWSGLFSYKSRSKEATEFYYAIKELDEKLKNEFPRATIHYTCLGYSHGGNIILGSGNAYRKDKDKNFHFDEVIFIGTPVQRETKGFINENLFKKINHYYSRKDKVVVLDFFSTSRFFSNRYFHQHSQKNPLPEKLRQIEIQITGKRTYIKKHGRKIHTNARPIDFSPGHTELWSFGWMESDVRIDFPFFPLPIGTFLPYYQKAIEEYPDATARHFITNLNHVENNMFVWPRFSFRRDEMPFIPPSFLESLYQYVEENRPKQFSKQEYNVHINNAIEKIKADKICARKEKARINLCRVRGLREQKTKCLL